MGKIIKLKNDTYIANDLYTSSPRIVGTYYDGKPIYRRCWEGTIQSGNNIPNFTNVAKIVNFGGMASVAGLNRALPYFEVYNNKRYGFTINLNGNNIRAAVLNNDVETSAFCCIWIEYTRTID